MYDVKLLQPKWVFIAIVFLIQSALASPATNVILNGTMNARSSANFHSASNNVLFVLEPGTQADILEHKKLPSGNYGFRIMVTSGPHKNKKAWVYYHVKQPSLQLDAMPEIAKKAKVIKRISTSSDVPQDLFANVISEGNICKNCGLQEEVKEESEFLDKMQQNIDKSPVSGAYRVMAALYQSCSVLQKRPYSPTSDKEMTRYLRITRGGDLATLKRVIPAANLQKIVDTHYYLKDLPNHSAPQCFDMKKTPPIYHYGGRQVVTEDNTIDLFDLRRTGGVPFVGIDCSAFVSAALSTSGLKLTPKVQTAEENVATSAGLAKFNSQNSCFKTPVFREKQSILPGDVIAYKGHTYMIDKVGRDPFGIQKLKQSEAFPSSAAGCRTLAEDKENFDFTIIQSAGTGSLPAMRIQAKDYNDGRATFRYLFRQACMAEFGEKTKADLVGIKILRHKGDEDPRCNFSEEETPKLRGEECTEGCRNEIHEELS